MLKSSLLAAGACLFLATPALAGWYIVHGPDRHCYVTERYTPGGDIVRVGPLSFGTRGDAEREIVKVCRDNGYYREERGMREERREHERY